MIVRKHLVPALGDYRLSKLTPDAVQAYMNRKLEDGLSPRTVEYQHSVLRRALGQAHRWDIVGRNVATLVSPPRVKRPELRPLTPAQARTLLDRVKGDRLEGLINVALALGLRQSEALGLNWSDVDLDGGWLSVRRTLQRYGGEYHLDETKTDRSTRTISVPAPLVDVLAVHRKRQLQERLIAGPAWSDDAWDLVFTTPDGRPMRGSSVTRRFQVILAEAGLPRHTFHGLRHACASFLLAYQVPMRVVMEILGHSQIQVTANVYSHVLPELQRDATDRITEALWSAS
jgi:integrase